MTKSLAPKGYGETYSDLVSRLSRDFSARQKLVPRTSDRAFLSSAWPTATAADGVRSSNTYAAGNLTLKGAALLWGTPTARDLKDGASCENVPENGLLGRMAANWATPTVNGNHNRKGCSDTSGDGLATQASQWSTPRATDGEKGGPNQTFGAGGIPLPAQAAHWPTPTSLSFAESHQPDNSKSYNETMRLAEPLSLRSILPDHPISTIGEDSSHIRRSLNPLFVEWLMGWLRGWTLLALTRPGSNDFACSEMELFHYKRLMRSAFLQLGLPPEAPPVQQSLFA
jgi:hypothetical protein